MDGQEAGSDNPGVQTGRSRAGHSRFRKAADFIVILIILILLVKIKKSNSGPQSKNNIYNKLFIRRDGIGKKK